MSKRNIIYDGQTSTSCAKELLSEMKDNFQPPALKRPTPTRSQRFEEFMWLELYNEYIRYYNALANAPVEPSNTEYFDEFCKNTPQEDLEAKEMLINRYPLHATVPITVYNQDGDLNKDFKRRYAITRPVHEQTQQFG